MKKRIASPSWEIGNQLKYKGLVYSYQGSKKGKALLGRQGETIQVPFSQLPKPEYQEGTIVELRDGRIGKVYISAGCTMPGASNPNYHCTMVRINGENNTIYNDDILYIIEDWDGIA